MEYYTKTRIIPILVFLQQFTKVMSNCTVLTAEDFKVTIISYPGDGSNNYNKNLDICWNITSDTPVLFSLSSDIGVGDFIKVYDGGDATVMTKEDKQSNTQTLIITPPIHLRFTSDGTLDSTKDKGFEFRFIAGNTTVPGCGGSLAATTTMDYIASTNFPEKYSKSQNCEWNITSAPNTTIQLVLKFMDVEYDAGCQYDYVQVIDSAGNDSNKLCKQFVWSPTFTFPSAGNNVKILLKSDQYSPRNGFVFTFTSSGIPLGGTQCSDNNVCEAQNSTCSNGTCVCISSFYKDAAVCRPKKGLGSSCTSVTGCKDTNTVCLSQKCSCSANYYDDNGVSTLGGQCIQIMSNCTVLTAEDFKVTIISYPGDGSNNYNKNLDICWNITSDTPVLFSLSSDIGAGDFIKVFDGGDATVMTKTDKQSNTQTAVITPPIHLRFTSDGNLDSTKDKGFEFRFIAGNSTVPGCGGSLAATTTMDYIASTNFPEKYNKNESCEWNIMSAPNTTIQLVLKFMDVESNAGCQYDYVQVIDPSGNDFNKLCKEFVWSPTFTFTSAGNNVKILLKSDEYSPKHGFVFTFTSSGIPLGGTKCSDNNVCEAQNSTCSNGTCVCISSFYRDAAMCRPKKGLGLSCISVAECKDTNTVCSSQKCSCSANYYDDNGVSALGGQCLQKKGLGSSCASVAECKDTNTVCSSQKCSCSANYYDDNGISTLGGQCLHKKGLGSSCASVAECKDTNTVCSSQKCSCSANYYDDNGVSTLGGQCLQKRELGTSCDTFKLCKDTHAECVSNKCKCKSEFYDDNGDNTDGGICQTAAALGMVCSGIIKCGKDYICKFGKCHCSHAYPTQRDGHCFTDDGNLGELIAGITVPTCILLISFIIIGCVFYIRRKKRQRYPDIKDEPDVVEYHVNPVMYKL